MRVTRARGASGDVDGSIYDGFIGDGDKRKFAAVRSLPPNALATHAFDFKDARMNELLFRYRARNWPETLDANDRVRWDDYRRQRLTRDAGLSEYSFESFFAEIAAFRTAHAGHGAKLALLDALEDWGRQRAAELS